MSKADFELAPLNEKVKDYHIIDTDFHLNVPGEKLIPYIDNSTVKRKCEEVGVPEKSAGLMGAYAKDTTVNAERIHGSAITTEEIVEVKEETGADEVICQPNNSLPFPHSNYEVMKNELLTAYNDWLVERVIDVDEGIYGALAVPDWNIDLALEELERYGEEKGIVAAQNWIPGYKPLGHKANDPWLEKVVSLDLPILLHVGGGSRPSGTLQSDPITSYVAFLGTPSGQNMKVVANMITSGMFDKYPELEIIIGEAGTNWIPAVAHRMDDIYQRQSEDVCLTERMIEMDQQYLSKMPSEYIWDHLYFTTQPIALPENRNEVEAILTTCHADEMYLFSTDWPHSTVDSANWVIDKVRNEETRKNIYHKNAQKAFRLP